MRTVWDIFIRFEYVRIVYVLAENLEQACSILLGDYFYTAELVYLGDLGDMVELFFGGAPAGTLLRYNCIALDKKYIKLRQCLQRSSILNPIIFL